MRSGMGLLLALEFTWGDPDDVSGRVLAFASRSNNAVPHVVKLRLDFWERLVYETGRERAFYRLPALSTTQF